MPSDVTGKATAEVRSAAGLVCHKGDGRRQYRNIVRRAHDEISTKDEYETGSNNNSPRRATHGCSTLSLCDGMLCRSKGTAPREVRHINSISGCVRTKIERRRSAHRRELKEERTYPYIR